MSGKVVKYPGRSKKSLSRNLLIVLIASLLGVAFFLYLGQVFAYWQAQSELEDLTAEVAELEEEKELLQREAELLQDEEYIEIEARRHLGMVRPGEIIFQVGE